MPMMMDETTTWRDFLMGTVAMLGMTVFGIGLMVGITLGLDWLFDDLVAAAIVAGAAPIIASTSLGIWNQYREHSEEVQLDRRQRRGEAYERFLDYLFDAIHQLDDEAKPDQLELEAERYSRFVQDLLVWGSDELIETWNEYRRVDWEALDRDEQRAWYGRLLAQVHKELRGSEEALSWEELYELYSMGDGDR